MYFIIRIKLVEREEKMNFVDELYYSLDKRMRSEDIAELIRKLISDQLSSKEKIILEKAAQGALSRRNIAYSSMPHNFRDVVGAKKQILKVNELFQFSKSQDLNDCNVEDIQKVLIKIEKTSLKQIGKNDFKHDRLNKSERNLLNLQLSKRQYNKRWRLAKRLEKKQKTVQKELEKNEFEKIAKHGLAHHIEYENFVLDLNSACFIAYFNARSNLRSVFTNESQERPFDEICEMLFNRCKQNTTTTSWWAIAYVYTSPLVLEQLSDHQKGELLGRWTKILEDIASFLEELWKNNQINRQTMIVKQGNDSSTWNHVAGAWNKARDQWMQLIYAMGLESLLDEICFGKVLRLMAGDVAAWHFNSGGQLDPNTVVWRNLPLPWEIFQHNVVCTKEEVIKQCMLAKIDPEKSGWIAPKIHAIVKFKPTPELVHGVEVGNPFLAYFLKKNKYFSGKL